MSKSLSPKSKKNQRESQFSLFCVSLNLSTLLLLLFWVWKYLQNSDVSSSNSEMVFLQKDSLKILVDTFNIVCVFITMIVSFYFVRKKVLIPYGKLFILIGCLLTLLSSALMQLNYSALNLWQSSLGALIFANNLSSFLLRDQKGIARFSKEFFAIITLGLVTLSALLLIIIVPLYMLTTAY